MAINHQIKLGDCIFCIISEQNLLPDTVWNHSNNAPLREKRQEMKGLLPGDVVFIPDARPKELSASTNQVHKFYMKGEKHLHWIEIELVGEDDQPVPNEKYRVVLPDGSIKEGNLDQSGWARIEDAPATAAQCEITFPELDKEAWKFIEATSAKQSSSP